MKCLQKEGASGKNLPLLLLLAVVVIEFLFITQESRFSGIGYYLAESCVVVPCLLFLGDMLGKKRSPFAERRLLLAVAAVVWFVLVQCIHKLSGMENHPLGTVFFVYLMAFPFAALTDDRKNTGLWWMGGMFVGASLVLVGYSILLMLDWVPQGLQAHVFWDGARLHPMWHPNIAACYFMIGIGFSGAFCCLARKKQTKALLLAAIVLQFLTMALTNCRTTLLLTGAMLGGVLFFRIFRGSWKQLVLGLLAAAVVLVGSFKLSGALFQWNNDRLMDSFGLAWEADAPGETDWEPVSVSMEQEIAEPASEQAPVSLSVVQEEEFYMNDDTGVIIGDNWQGSLADDMRTLNGRTLIWGSALQAIRDNKALALWGTEYTGTVISVYNPFEVVHAHNSWMEALLRMGLPGLLVSLVFTVISVWSAARLVLGKNVQLWKKIIAMMTMCVMAAGFLEPYLFITNVYYHVLDLTFFFCTGYLDFWCSCPQEEN